MQLTSSQGKRATLTPDLHQKTSTHPRPSRLAVELLLHLVPAIVSRLLVSSSLEDYNRTYLLFFFVCFLVKFRDSTKTNKDLF